MHVEKNIDSCRKYIQRLHLLTLQKLKSKIDKEVTNKMKVPKGETNNKDLISLSYDFSVEIEKLFEDFIKENNLEQKDKKET